jgi:ArsR family transcriptional regulator
MMAALSNPARIQILAKLAGGRDYVSRLAREIGISRPLLHMHLQRLESAGLVAGTLEVSEAGKAMRFYEVTTFDVRLTPEAIAEASRTLTSPEPLVPPARKEP